MENSTKVCKACKIKKKLNEFFKDGSSKQGYKARCKSCIKNKIFSEPLIDISRIEGVKVCKACLKQKSLLEFHKDPNTKDGYNSKCCLCKKEGVPINPIVETLVGESKQCKVCYEDKDLSLFPTRSDRDYKYESRCRECKKKGLKIDRSVFTFDGRKCSCCKEVKQFSEYHKCRTCPMGVTNICKSCQAVKNKMYRDSKSPEVKRAEKRLEYEKHKERYKENSKKYKKENKDKLLLKGRIRDANRRRNDNMFKLRTNLRSLMKINLIRFVNENKDLTEKGKRTLDILGCSFEEFKQHIESQFLPWMSWSNYGNTCKGEPVYNCSWDLDHIIPCNYAKTEEELNLLNYWSNFQPLCSKVNRHEKRASVPIVTNIILNITTYEE